MKGVRKISAVGLRILWVILLTVFTQIGGLIYLFSRFVWKSLRLSWWKRQLAFLVLYFLVSFLLVPPLARIFGREPLPMTGSVKPVNVATCVLNRHYVDRGMVQSMKEISHELRKTYPEIAIEYLDANFPFMDGFPLLPHWSHSDGRKVDLAFYYQDKKSKKFVIENASWIGYGVFENPVGDEVNTGDMCEKNGYWQYNLLGLLPSRYDLEVEPDRTSALVELLAKTSEVEKIFIEPHLKERWGLSHISKIRFHGCHAVSHADHIHIQVRTPKFDL